MLIVQSFEVFLESLQVKLQLLDFPVALQNVLLVEFPL